MSREEEGAIARLNVIGVEGDGNCLFRALFVCLHGNQLLHAQLRTSIVNHLINHGSTISASAGFVSCDPASIAKAADVMRKPGS